MQKIVVTILEYLDSLVFTSFVFFFNGGQRNKLGILSGDLLLLLLLCVFFLSINSFFLFFVNSSDKLYSEYLQLCVSQFTA